MKRPLSAGLLGLGLLGLVLTTSTPPTARAGNDAEAATHGDKASTPQVSFEETHGDFFIRQYQLGCLSQLSYLIGSGGEAAVVDPQRDIEHYVRDAEAHGVRITAVILTHTNADFVAGHTELAKRLGAKIYISAESHSAFPYVGLHDRDELMLGGTRIAFWATPGHTLDSMTVLVSPPDAALTPTYALTGDTLFIGGIGRPDLVGGDITPSVLGSKSFDSIQRLKTLPDATKVLPAHGAGSLCGAHLSDDTTSTIGAERATNPYLLITARAPFVAKVVSGLPVAPQYFKFNVAMNRQGPPIVAWTDETPPVKTAAQIAAALDKGAWLLDLRDQAAYASGHVKGSINVAVRGRLDTWTGIVVPFNEDLYLLGTEDEVTEATFRLRRVGYDRMAGYLKGGIDAWRSAGREVRTSKLIDAADLERQIASGNEPMIVDVRTPNEFAEQRIGNYANIPVDLYQRLGKTLDKSKPVVLMCNSAYRSSMTVGLAEREGFTDIGSLSGGLHAWVADGRPVIAGDGHAAAVAPAPKAAAAAAPAMLLPEIIASSALATALMDAPSLYAVIDVRPAWQYAEYHVPGATNLAPGEVAAHIRTLAAGTRIVLVDRDGSVAFAVAGAVLRELGPTAPSLRVLAGGTSTYWSEIELGDAPAPAGETGAGSAPSSQGDRNTLGTAQAPGMAPATASLGASASGSTGPTAPNGTQAAPANAAPAAPAAPAAKPQAKKRSAGC